MAKQKPKRERFTRKAWMYLDNIKNESSKDAVISYLDYLKAAKEVKDLSIENTTNVLRNMANAMDKVLSDVTREDLESYFANNIHLMDSTKVMYKTQIKAFYRHHLGDGEEYPANVKWIKVRRIMKDRTSEDMLTKEDVRKLVEACHNPRDQAIVAALYESGLRFGEFMHLRKKDIRFKDNYARIVLPAEISTLKTGRRVVAVVDCVPYLRSWINTHPIKDDDAPLWISLKGATYGKEVQENVIRASLKLIAERAGVDVNLTPHLFRHSRATEVAKKGWNEDQMRKYFGWSRTSAMPSFYTHLASEDVEKRVLQDAGLKEIEKPEESPLAPWECNNCSHQNEASNTFCGNCGKPTSLEAVVEMEETEEATAPSVMAGFSELKKKHPEVYEEFLQDIAKAMSKSAE